MLTVMLVVTVVLVALVVVWTKRDSKRFVESIDRFSQAGQVEFHPLRPMRRKEGKRK